MEEEDYLNIIDELQQSLLCECYFARESKISEHLSPQKEFMLNVVSRTENYLKERRLPELLRFFFTKVVAEAPMKPIAYLEKLLIDCMLFRAGHGVAPTLYEDRHLEAVIKSFDPSRRGWLSPGQVRRLCETLGFPMEDSKEDIIEVKTLLEDLKNAQENSLLQLLSAGISNDNSIIEIKKPNDSNTNIT